MRFDGKVALITGAAHGMGACEALGFAQEGAHIIAVDIAKNISDLGYNMATNDELSGLVNEIRQIGRRAIALTADVSKSHEVKRAVDEAIAEFGRIDILVNNAGVVAMAPLIHLKEEQIDSVIDVNVKGVLYCCKHVIPHMAKQRYGKIINISSGAGLGAIAKMSAYAASKYAVLGLTEALASELCHYNINVNAVCPGLVFTPLGKQALAGMAPGVDIKEALRGVCDENFLRREITAQDVANAVMFLASEEARNITSHWLAVDSAQHKKTPPLEPCFTV